MILPNGHTNHLFGSRFCADDVICMETFKDHPQLGRFTLRDEG